MFDVIARMTLNESTRDLGQVHYTPSLDRVPITDRDELVTLLVDVFLYGVAARPTD